MYRALPETAFSLVEVPVYPADLARNHCLNVLSALAARIWLAARPKWMTRAAPCEFFDIIILYGNMALEAFRLL